MTPNDVVDLANQITIQLLNMNERITLLNKLRAVDEILESIVRSKLKLLKRK